MRTALLDSSALLQSKFHGCCRVPLAISLWATPFPSIVEMSPTLPLGKPLRLLGPWETKEEELSRFFLKRKQAPFQSRSTAWHKERSRKFSSTMIRNKRRNRVCVCKSYQGLSPTTTVLVLINKPFFPEKKEKKVVILFISFCHWQFLFPLLASSYKDSISIYLICYLRSAIVLLLQRPFSVH